jgi:hypothetical protein
MRAWLGIITCLFYIEEITKLPFPAITRDPPDATR